MWIGIAVFVVGTAAAAFAPWRPVVVAALVVVLLDSLWHVVRSGAALVAAGGWSPLV
ncbi:hypothetical protein [Brevundimonas sp.]|uniref:hypothetical protein n=1 Tax=Brevundimonas sp. TaxID=1871086 RepID=UPI00356653AB